MVSGEPLSPPENGGRIRTTRLAEALAGSFSVCVLSPGSPLAELDHLALPDRTRPRTRATFASLQPALGQTMLPPLWRQATAAAVRQRRPGVVLFAQSHLAAVAPPLAAKTVVDFHDVEVHRLASLARHGAPRKRIAWALEYAKARRWEPVVARRAALAVAVSNRDAARLSAWGADVVCVPHGADRGPLTPSPATGPVTFVGSMRYGPNVDAISFLLHEVWPRVRAQQKDLRLRIVGSHAATALGRHEGVEVISDAPDVDRLLADAALVVAPAREGGGAQLKVAQALARGRIVVATPHSLLSAPTGAAGAVMAADGPDRFAELVVRLWRDVDERRALERVLREPVVPTWEQVTRPLVVQLERILRRE